jgi:hypothetical protein
MDRKVIKSNRLARVLIQQGFKVVDIAPDKLDSRRSVFVFEMSYELKLFLDNYRKEA